MQGSASPDAFADEEESATLYRRQRASLARQLSAIEIFATIDFSSLASAGRSIAFPLIILRAHAFYHII